jgi:membrane fusion protein (multidrug efflux system)
MSEGLNKKKLGILILVAVLLIGAIAGIWWTISLRSTLKTENAKVTGDLTDVSAKVSGKVSKIYIEEGQEVKAGQLLVKLDDSQYKINLEQAQAALHVAQANYQKLPDDVKSAGAAVDKSVAGVTAAQASLRSSQVALDDAKRQLEKNKELFTSGAISEEVLKTYESNLDKAQSNYDAAAANVEASQAGLNVAQITVGSLSNSTAAVYMAQIEQAQATYNSAKLAEDNTSVYAEFSGNVLRIPVSVGENITASQTLLTLSNLKNTWITANIDEKKISRVKVGEEVKVSIDAFPGKVFTGKVIEVGTASQSTFSLLSTDSTSGSFTKVAQRIPVKIKVDSGDIILKPGMSAVVKIRTK